MGPIPCVRRSLLDGPSFIGPLVENVPVMLLAIAPMPPVRRAGEDEIHARRRKEREEVVSVTATEETAA